MQAFTAVIDPVQVETAHGAPVQGAGDTSMMLDAEIISLQRLFVTLLETQGVSQQVVKVTLFAGTGAAVPDRLIAFATGFPIFILFDERQHQNQPGLKICAVPGDFLSTWPLTFLEPAFFEKCLILGQGDR